MTFLFGRPLLALYACILGTFVTFMLNLPHCVIYKSTLAIHDVRRIQSQIDMLHAFDKVATVDTIDAWLTGRLPATHPIADWLGEGPDRDPWGNSYCCCLTLVPNNVRKESIGVYSHGEDGVSTSHGNDRDDLNSWNGQGDSWYTRRINNRNLTKLVFQLAIFIPIAYVVLLGCREQFCVGRNNPIDLRPQSE